jgi:hypothetical protein
MADLIVEELLDGPEFGIDQRDYVYLVSGTEDIDTALSAVDDEGNLYFPPSESLREINGRWYEAEDPRGIWYAKNCIKVTQTWNISDDDDDDDEDGSLSNLEIAFEFGSTMEKRIRAIAQTKLTSNSDDIQGLIGVTKDGIEGIEVPIPLITFTITKTFSWTTVTDAFLNDIYEVEKSPVNTSKWFLFKAGEVRFDGASTTREWNSDAGKFDWKISFKFTARPTEDLSDLDMYVINQGSTEKVTGTKKGWEHLDLRVKEGMQDGDEVKLPVIVGAWLDQVMYEGDFGKLRLGGIDLDE